MNIENGKVYKIKGKSKYFTEKYGYPNPLIKIEGTDKEVFGQFWGNMNGNPACLMYAMRSVGIPLSGQVYYGKIGGLGECVHESELESTEEE